MARNLQFPQVGDDVGVKWGLSTVRGRVLEVYGPEARRHVLVAVDLGGWEGDELPTVSLPIAEVRPFAATS